MNTLFKTTRLSLRAIEPAAFLMALMMALAGCDRSPVISGSSTTGPSGKIATRAAGDKPYTVVVTTQMIADIVKNVAGDQATVRALMGAGVDPHMYRATRDDVTAMLSADVVFYNGLNLEGKMGDAFVKVAAGGRPVFAVTELLDEKYLLEPEQFGGHFDPHVWMDPNGWIKAAQVVVDKLTTYDSARSAFYRGNGDRYIAELKRLDEYARDRLATIPADRRVLVTAHDAFNYFARAYGVEVLGIQGISTDSEAGLKQVDSLIDLLVSRKIGAVFTESSVSDRYIRALVEGAKARGHDVRIGGELFSDAMGAGGTYEGNYLGMIDHNVTKMVRALGGEAPERGMNGKLHAEEKHAQP